MQGQVQGQVQGPGALGHCGLAPFPLPLASPRRHRPVRLGPQHDAQLGSLVLPQNRRCSVVWS